ncbi:MAG: MBL fold metallo-hydrolase [Sulfurimonas sp.]|nr:MAG: MBL fold metallo-hydrolase [Sulfurimonas sp.]
MLKKMINPLVVSAIALLPMMTACSSDSSKSESANTAKEIVTPIASNEFQYKLDIKKVAENVWCAFGAIEAPTKENAGNMANSCFIKTTDGLVVLDTGPSYIFAKQTYAAMSKIIGSELPVKVIVNTHDHDDHWLGNGFYKAKFNTQLIGSSLINKNYKAGDKTRMFRVLPANAIKGTNIIPVDNSLTKSYKFTVGATKFEVIPIGVKAHTAEDYFLYMPNEKILFAGDLVMNGRITSGRDGSVIGQITALDMIKAKDWKVLIPGHGVITDSHAMDEATDYFTFTRDRVSKAIEDDVDAADIQGAVPMLEFKNKAMYDILHNNNLDYAYEEIEMMD